MIPDVSIDLETMGTSNDAAIVAIGAVKFDRQTGKLGGEFYAAVELASCIEEGLSVDGSTVDWWLSQSDEARRALFPDDRTTIRHALVSLAQWFPKKVQGVWGNGVGFDNIILRGAFKALKVQCPWHFRFDRDMRTIMDVAPVSHWMEPPEGETKHLAVDDARNQARIIAAHYKSIRRAK